MIRRLVDPLVNAQRVWAEPLGSFYQRLFGAIYRIPYLKDFLNGTWLGHPLHPLLTDIPIGALVAAFVLDLVGLPTGALWVIGIGWLGLIAAALAGFADYLDIADSVHATTMTAALVSYSVSLGIRVGWIGWSADVAVWTAGIGLALIVVGSYLGGDLVFELGSQVDRHAWRGGGTNWVALEVSDVVADTPTKVRAGAQSLVVVRHGEDLWALHDTCSHMGCSLSEGKLVDGRKIECPCHGSRFELANGHVSRGPAVYPQPVYEVRRNAGKIEVRRQQ